MKLFFPILLIVLSHTAIQAQPQCAPATFDTVILSQLSKDLTTPLVLRPKDAADIVINTFYQNCEAANLPPYDILERGEMRGYELRKHPWNGGSASNVTSKSLAQSSQYYIQCPGQARPSCLDLCKEPPTYLWGGKGVYSNEGELDLFRNEGSIQKLAEHPGIDCSGFVNAVFATAGLKVRLDMNAKEVAANVPASWYMRPSQCFKEVNANEGFKSGDIISWRKHLVMIDNTSRDPFSLKDIDHIDKCSSRYLDPLKFNLVVSNSVGGVNDVNRDGTFSTEDLHGEDNLKSLNVPITGVGVGVSKIPFGHLALKYPTEVMELAKNACYAKFGKSFRMNNINVTRHVLADEEPMPASHECMEDVNSRTHLKGLKCLSENCQS